MSKRSLLLIAVGTLFLFLANLTPYGGTALYTLFWVFMGLAYYSRYLDYSQRSIPPKNRSYKSPPSFHHPSPTPPVDEEQLKNVYKKLLRKYHPDYARSPEDIQFRTELTAKLNKAYSEKDFKTLKMFE